MPQDSKLPPQQPQPTEDPTQAKEAMNPQDSAPGEPKTDDIQETKQMDEGNKPTPEKKPRNKKKIVLMIVIILLILGAIGAAVWYFVIRDDAAPVVEEQQTETTQEETVTGQPVNVAYAFRDADNVPFTLFTRPAAGGERSQAQVLDDRDATPAQSDVQGQNVAFVANEDVYLSTDSGESYDMVLDSKADEQVTSLKFSSDGSKLAVGHLASPAGTNTIQSIDTSTKESAELFDGDSAGVFVLGLNDTTIIYQESCYNCDDRPTEVLSNNLEGSDKTTLAESSADSTLSNPVASKDLSTVLYVDNGVNPAPVDLSDDVTGPYKLTSLDVSSKEKTVLATVGKAGEKNANGTNKVRSFILGFSNDNQTPWYAEGKQVVALRDSNPVIFESDNFVSTVFFADSNSIIVSTSAEQFGADSVLSNFNRKTQESTEILQADSETRIFGVTTN